MKLLKTALVIATISIVVASCKKEEDDVALDRDKFFGTWNVNSQGTQSGTQNYVITITGAASGIEQIVISNFDQAGTAANSTVYADVSGNNLLIPATVVYPPPGGQVTVEGTGNYNNGTITFNYTATDSQVDTVTATATK